MKSYLDPELKMLADEWERAVQEHQDAVESNPAEILALWETEKSAEECSRKYFSRFQIVAEQAQKELQSK